MDGVILAIDLGKFNSVLCWYDRVTKSTAFRSVKTTPTELRRELQRQPIERVVLEACSSSGWVHDLCEVLGLVCDVANTNGTAWQWKNVKRKTDRDDALKLAKLSSLGELPTDRERSVGGEGICPRSTPSHRDVHFSRRPAGQTGCGSEGGTRARIADP